MVLDLDRRLRLSTADTAETPRPRSLALALARMGFRPAVDQTRLPVRSWHGDRDDPAPDWQPV